MIIGNRVYRQETVKSSFDWVKENLGMPDGTAFVAGYIEQARGRQGRVWQADKGQILLTVLLKPNDLIAEDLTILNMALSIGVQDALKQYDVGLKWPNDFIVKGKKVGGIMFESIFEGERLVAVIAGIGINVNNRISDELKDVAISFSERSGELNLENMLSDILSSCDKFYKMFLDGAREEIFELWKEKQICIGKLIKVHKFDGEEISGIATGILENGDLLLDLRDGSKQKIPFSIVEFVSLKI